MNAGPSQERRPTRRVAATPETVVEAAALLRGGALVAFPTETVYGLGADATSDTAVAAIYAAKARPTFNPLIAHVHGLDAALREGLFSDVARTLAAVFWPGPLTLVVPVAAGGQVSLLVRAGLDTVALRVPDHPVARSLIRAAGRPVAAPSANRSGRVSPTRADHVATDLEGRIDMIIDGGACPVGVESTIVACLGQDVRILRTGAVTREAIEATLGRAVAAASGAGVIAPGMLAGHYAPRAILRLAGSDVRTGEAALDFGGRLRGAVPAGSPYLDLSAAGDLQEAAANLYRHLRSLDASMASGIVAAPVPATGLGAAINDRLTRAAAPRGDR